MKHIIAAAVILAAALCCSCGNVNNDSTDNVGSTADNEAVISEISEKETEPEKTAYISPLAKEQLLLPLENHSWEMTEKAEYVMLHFTSAVVVSKNDPFDIASIRSIFKETNVSIHYVIDREGNILCWLPETRAAWHAGRGTFADDDKYTNAMNKYSIGIEMLAIGSKKDMEQYLTAKEYDKLDDELIGFTDAQYSSLRELSLDICERHGIPFDREHIIGHDMYNPEKSDPGELFEWERLFCEE